MFSSVRSKGNLSEHDELEVKSTVNCDEALSILSDHKFDLMIGFVYALRLRRLNFISLLRERYPDLPLVVLSASENATHIRKCLELGVTGFVIKSCPKSPI